MADFYDQMIGLPWPGSTSVTYSTMALNQSTDSVYGVFQAEKSATITRLGFRCSAFTGTATTWRISIQGTNGTNGRPDGTVKGGGSPAEATFTSSILVAGEWEWVTLANSYAMTTGEDFTIVIEYSSGTAPSAGVNDLTVAYNIVWTPSNAFPYTAVNDNGTHTTQTGVPLLGWGSSAVAYGYPLQAALNTAFTSASSPAVYGNRFTLPADWGSTYKISGARLVMSSPSFATHSFDIRLYSGSTVLQTVSRDSEISAGTTSRARMFFFDNTALSTLNFGDTYYIALAPTTNASFGLTGASVASVADWDAWQGQQIYSAASFNGSTWTETTTSRYFIELIISDWTKPSAGNTYIFNQQG